jgi:hemoglobin
MAEDLKFALFPAGRSDFSRKRTRQLTVDFLCEATGGPCHYFGLDLTTAHQGLGITEQLWKANIKYLTEVLDQLKPPPPEKKELLDLVAAYKESVIEK